MVRTKRTARKSTPRKRNKITSPATDTSMLLGFEELGERIVAERTTTCTTSQLRLPSIIDSVGCDITIDDIQSTVRELIKEGFKLKKDVNKIQKALPHPPFQVDPLTHFCVDGNLLIVRVLFLIGADCSILRNDGPYRFPMLAAAHQGHLDICKWLFEYGGDAKYQINTIAYHGWNPLGLSYTSWADGEDKDGKTCRWLLLNGGGQHLSSEALHHLFYTDAPDEEIDSNLLVLWMRENIQLYDNFMLLLGGAISVHRQRSLQILHGHPGIMEVIGDYVGLIRGKELRMLQEFNELVIEYINRDENS